MVGDEVEEGLTTARVTAELYVGSFVGPPLSPGQARVFGPCNYAESLNQVLAEAFRPLGQCCQPEGCTIQTRQRRILRMKQARQVEQGPRTTLGAAWKPDEV